MKTTISLYALAIGFPLLFAIQFPPGYPSPPMTWTTGVVIKVDGGVIIDEWNYYDTTPGTINPNKKFPTSVQLGKSIKDPVNVCFEFTNGTICEDIGRIRSLIEADSKKTPQQKDK